MIEVFFCIFLVIFVIAALVPPAYQFRLAILCAAVMFCILGYMVFHDTSVRLH